MKKMKLKPVETFEEIPDGQLFRELLARYVPENTKAKILIEYKSRTG